MKNIAIIDLGSNSVRMIIMQIQPNGAYKMIEQVKSMVKLSEGMWRDQRLQEGPIQRTLYTLSLFNELMQVHHVEEVYSLATAAVRNAENSDVFLERVHRDTQLDFRVITGEQEAYYDYLGVKGSLDYRDYLLIDTGGGSTELVLVREGKVKQSVSIPQGAITLTEAYDLTGAVSKEKLHEAQKAFGKAIDEIKWLKQAKNLPIIGIGGTLRSLAKIHMQAEKLPLKRIHGLVIESHTLEGYIEKIQKMTLEERMEVEGIGKERAEVIIGGLIPIQHLLETLKPVSFIMSNKGLREGFFFEYYAKRVPHLPAVLEYSVENTLKNYQCNMRHHQHVAQLTMDIFDSLKETMGFTSQHQKWLRTAALLHDIGMHIDYFDHQDHSFYLILNTGIDGLSHEDLVKCAFIAGMHRIERKLSVDWKTYQHYMDKEDYKIIKKLSLILMIAEKIERRESGVVKNISGQITDKEYIIELESHENLMLEIAALSNLEKAFRKNYKRQLRVKQK